MKKGKGLGFSASGFAAHGVATCAALDFTADYVTLSENVDLAMIIVPIPSKVETDEAHAEVLRSPLFEARLKSVGNMIKLMKKAINEKDVPTIRRLAEEDSLNLHASTITGKTRMFLWEPETVLTIKNVIKMREEGLPA